MPNQKHWTAASPHRKPSKIRNQSVETNEADCQIETGGRCDGYEAGRLLAMYGLDAVPVICERVALYRGRPDGPQRVDC